MCLFVCVSVRPPDLAVAELLRFFAGSQYSQWLTTGSRASDETLSLGPATSDLFAAMSDAGNGALRDAGCDRCENAVAAAMPVGPALRNMEERPMQRQTGEARAAALKS